MTWTPPPPASIMLVGEFSGNNMPDTEEYVVRLIAETEDEWRLTTETVYGTIVNDMTMTADDARNIRSVVAGGAAGTEVPGLIVEPRWELGDTENYLVLGLGHLDEVSAWLEFWMGEATWDGGEDWEW